jgi:hypothetical protein
MSTQLWIGFGFGALFFVFLMVAFFAAKNLTQGQHLILRVMTSLCAAMAAGLISGDASIQVTQALPGGRITGAFGAGIAVLIGVLLLFPRFPKPPKPVLTGAAINFSIPPEWTFQAGVQGLAVNENTTVRPEGFTKEELDAPMQTRELHAESLTEALRIMRLLTLKSDAVRKYDVFKDGLGYRLKVK